MFYSPHVETCESSHSGAARQTSFEAEMASFRRVIRHSSHAVKFYGLGLLLGGLVLLQTHHPKEPFYLDIDQTRALYINLDRRTDRSARIHRVLNNANIRHERLIAVEVSHQPGVDECWGNAYCAGQIGCQLSHMRGLKYAMWRGLTHIFIFEDDFDWLPSVDPNYVLPAISRVTLNIRDWDLIAISLNLLKYKAVRGGLKVDVSAAKTSEVVKIVEAQATQAYLVRAAYVPKLYEAFRNCDILSDPLVAIDTCWKDLQRTGNWYGFMPQLGKQTSGYSDIENRNVQYDMKGTY